MKIGHTANAPADSGSSTAEPGLDEQLEAPLAIDASALLEGPVAQGNDRARVARQLQERSEVEADLIAEATTYPCLLVPVGRASSILHGQPEGPASAAARSAVRCMLLLGALGCSPA